MRRKEEPMQTYEREILTILAMAGNKGLKRGKIARHVYNACNSMFAPLVFEDVYAAVSQYLYKSSKTAGSLVTKGGFGIYKLDRHQAAARQLHLFYDEGMACEPIAEPNDAEQQRNNKPVPTEESLFLFNEEDEVTAEQ